MPLHQIIYTSHATVPMSPAELLDLLAEARHYNAAAGITGLLLHADGSFMQTIEGEFAAVQALFARIECDPRHSSVILISDEPIAERSFDDWSMAFREVDAEDIARIPGLERAFMAGAQEPDRNLARRIMRTFAASSGLDA
jgi:hypothetical protein